MDRSARRCTGAGAGPHHPPPASPATAAAPHETAAPGAPAARPSDRTHPSSAVAGGAEGEGVEPAAVPGRCAGGTQLGGS